MFWSMRTISETVPIFRTMQITHYFGSGNKGLLISTLGNLDSIQVENRVYKFLDFSYALVACKWQQSPIYKLWKHSSWSKTSIKHSAFLWLSIPGMSSVLFCTTYETSFWEEFSFESNFIHLIRPLEKQYLSRQTRWIHHVFTIV